MWFTVTFYRKRSPLIHEKKFARNRNGFCEMDFKSEFTKGTDERKKKENKL